MVHQKESAGWGIRDLAGGRRPVGQAVKTAASHADNVGSIPPRVTKRFRRGTEQEGKEI